MAREGPKTAPREAQEGEDEPKSRAFRPKRPRETRRGPQEGRTGSREAAKRPEGAPRGCQGAAQESPNSQKALMFVRFLRNFRALVFSASRRSKTGQEAPKIAPRRPNRLPRQPQDGLIASDETASEAPTTAQERPKTAPRRPKRGDAIRKS